MITHVAIRFQGKIWSLPSPNRHHDIVREIIMTTDATYVDVPLEDEGFLDETGTFYNRKQALMHALLHEQIKNPERVRASMLTSEDVW